MKCPRCYGMTVNEQVYTDQGEIEVSRCIHCGDVQDKVVIFNRRHPSFRIKKVFRGCAAVASIPV
ncbi:MAG: hypothetical protein ACE5F7_08350 [Nitrospiria bacterium]